jgi:hypothetical protein
MSEEEQGYRAYLVRLWQARSRGQIVWRASVEDAHSGERRGFADLAHLFAFLEEAAGQPLDTGCSERNQVRKTRRKSP